MTDQEQSADPIIDPRWRELTALQRDILTVLAVEGEQYPPAIHRLRGGDEGTDAVTHTNLSALREVGYVERADEYEYHAGRGHWLTAEGEAVVLAGVCKPADNMML